MKVDSTPVNLLLYTGAGAVLAALLISSALAFKHGYSHGLLEMTPSQESMDIHRACMSSAHVASALSTERCAHAAMQMNQGEWWPFWCGAAAVVHSLNPCGDAGCVTLLPSLSATTALLLIVVGLIILRLSFLVVPQRAEVGYVQREHGAVGHVDRPGLEWID